MQRSGAEVCLRYKELEGDEGTGVVTKASTDKFVALVA